MKLSLPEVTFALAIALAVMAASWFGLSQALGAHPWWAQRTGLIGAPIGCLLFLTLRACRIDAKWIALVALVVLIVAAIVANLSKSIFVNAEGFNATAGRNWFVSWITIWACVALLFPTVFAARIK